MMPLYLAIKNEASLPYLICIINIFVKGMMKESWSKNLYPFSNGYPGNLGMKLNPTMEACLLEN